MENIKYVLYLRKSTESEERQVMSIDSQLNEMVLIGKKERLNIVDIQKESHSAKEQGQRPVFNKIIEKIKSGKYTGILTWAPDRLARNAGDLGVLVDLMDKELLKKIKTYTQTFTNNPNEKFLLMILGSQAKLENDNRSINIKRGIKAKIEKGLWHCSPPTGYEINKDRTKPGELEIDEKRAEVIKEIFNKYIKGNTVIEIYHWLNYIKFKSRRNKPLSVGNIYTILKNTFYYGEFEFPKESGNWHKGKHIPLISKETHKKVIEKINFKNNTIKHTKRENVFANLIQCGYCLVPLQGYVQPKKLINGTTANYTYYRCLKRKNVGCRNSQIRDTKIMNQLKKMIENMDMQKISKNGTLREQIKGIQQYGAMIGNNNKQTTEENIRNYMLYQLEKGNVEEKREIIKGVAPTITYISKEIYINDKIKL